MTAACPDCGKDLTITVTHQGNSSDGTYQRAQIEATHSTTPCVGWTSRSHDLVALAAAAQ